MAVVCLLLSLTMAPTAAYALVATQMDVPDETTDVLFVGNSFTRYQESERSVAAWLNRIAKANNVNLYSASIVYGRAPLSTYSAYDLSDSTRYKKFESTLASRQWDYVVLQEKSDYPITNPVDMYCAIDALAQRVREVWPQAKILLYMTHGFSNGVMVTHNGTPVSLTSTRFSAYSQAYYEYVGRRLAERYDIAVVPVGMYFNKSALVQPLTRLIGDDNKHPVPAGYFLAACAFYEAIVGQAPVLPVPITGTVSLGTDEQLGLMSVLGTSLDGKPVDMTLEVGEQAQLMKEIGAPKEGLSGDEAPGDGGMAPGLSDGEMGEGSSLEDGLDGGIPDDSQSTDDSVGADTPPDLQSDGDTSGEVDSSLDGSASTVPSGDGSTDVESPNADGEDATQLVPAITGEDGVAFTSMDPKIATVDESGNVTGVSKGRTAIVMENGEGDRMAFSVSVERKELIDSKLMFSWTGFSLEVESQMKILPLVSGSLGDYSLIWQSSNPSVASVDALGKVSALRIGASTISVVDVVSGVAASYQLSVTPKPIAEGGSGAASEKKETAQASENTPEVKASVSTSTATKKVVRLKAPRNVRTGNMLALLPGKRVMSLVVKWKPVSGARAYKVYRRAGSGSYRVIATVKAPIYIDVSAPRNKKLSYRIVAKAATAKRSSVKSAPAAGIRLGVSKLYAKAKGKRRAVNVKWVRNRAASGYLIYRAKQGSLNYKLVKRITKRTKGAWVDTSVKRGSTYKYKVCTYRKIGGKTYVSMYSNVKSVKVPRKK